jgi:galactokinase
MEKALLCQKAEHEYAGMPCGIMDQFISTMAREGYAMLLDCRTRKPELIPMDDPEVTVLVINTNVKHELTGSEYPTRRKQCETAAHILGVKALRDATLGELERAKPYMDHAVYKRAHHVITENERTLKAAEAMRQRDWISFGRLMYESHQSLRNDYEVSCAELDVVVEIASGLGLEKGVYGCRMTGGGFGGCCVALVKTHTVSEVEKVIKDEYKKRTAIEATVFATKPAQGATILKQ